METQNVTSLPRVEADNSSTRLEAQPTSDGSNEESAPSLDRVQAHPRGAKLKRYNKTTSTIIGLYLAALLCSIAHYVFFDRLHGTIASGEHASISQSYATFISLLLITLFKASLLGCVGLCSTQYLWRVLRGQPIALSTIESLFQMRHNPVNLFYRHTILSLSFLLAAYTWIVPLATIYPSGTLTISATAFVLTESVRTSVPELVFGSDFDPIPPENISRLASFAGIHHELQNLDKDDRTSETLNVRTNLQVMNPQGFLIRFLKSVIAAGEIALEPTAALGENSTYMLDFMGPQLSCQTVERSNQTNSKLWDFIDLALNKTSVRAQMDENDEWQITQQTMLGSQCLAPQENVRTLGDPTLVNDTDPLYLVEILKTKCTDKYVRYIANITFARGIRSIRYTIHDIEPQPAKSVIVRMYWEAGSDKIPVNEGQRQEELMHAAFTASSYFQRSQVYLKERFRYWNAFTIYYAFMSAIESQTSRYCVPLDAELQCDTKSTTSNSSRAVFVPLTCGKGDYTTTSILENSRLNPYRYLTSGAQESTNVTTDVNVTEAGLNELLTNITFSLMSLNLWTDDVNVTTTSYRNTYDFSHKINLVLPYALCLAVGLPIVALGVWSLQSNGVPATDGFMQVMMATRGRTEMEKLVLEQEMVYTDKASNKLRNLKVRFGELVTDNIVKEERAFGFGTAVETVGIKRRI